MQQINNRISCFTLFVGAKHGIGSTKLMLSEKKLGGLKMTLLTVLLAFCGGVFGAILGAMEAFIFTGITGLIGIAFVCAGIPFDWLGIISFGPFFAPNIAFAGGVAAAAYARKIKVLDSGKNITLPLLSLKKISVLIVGGVFGVLGYIIAFGVGKALPGQIDAGGFTVVVSAMIAKVLFTGELFGNVGEEDKKLGGRYSPLAKTTWVAYMTAASEKTILAISAGGLSAYVTYIMLQNQRTADAAAYVGFCISAVSLIFLQFGAPVPVTHHITICASYAVLASGGNLYWGITAAILAAFAGDFLARTFYNYGDVHIDPPAMTIALVSFLFLGLAKWVGLYQIPGEIAAVVIIIIASAYSFLEFNWLKKKTGDQRDAKFTA